ncbi:PorT family protein [Pontibacter sp. 172403-2]|uniref:porin family protein n=1 Tax=Pontibacter rufus TaxID=2791028 RepID=UPI0018AFCEF7|nr:porin family protein [Pontibacter sp. 172403-2]MBF9253489.1 PorT family protein [Pontibacter sp. 172403-2]
MKKSLLLLLLLLTTGIAAKAQFFTAGVKAGVSSSSIDVDNIENNITQFKEADNITGYHAGAFLRFKSGNVFVQPEGLLTYTGGKVEVSDDPNSSDVHIEKFNFSRLDVPILLGYSFFKVLRLNAGPVASVLLNGKFEGEKIDQYLEDTEWGWQAGVGLDIGNLTADVRYQTLQSSYKNDAQNSGFDIENGQIMLSLGIKIIGK